VKQPRATRAGRLWDYLGEMFPPALQIPGGLASFASVYLCLQALAGDEPTLTWRALGGAVTVVLFALLMRVYDELKDVETDLRLGRAGDPRYKDRAVVTGRVRPDDIAFLRWLVTGLIVAVNLPLGRWPLAVFVPLFFLGWLSFRWFFWPAMKQNLLLAFATHNPITPVVGVYIVAVYVQDFGAAGLTGWTIPLVVAAWFPIAAWETSRKVRHPDDETDYQTYSKVLGWRAAALLPAFFVIGSAACLIAVSHAADLSWIYSAAVGLVAALAVGACLRFRLRPSPAAANLRPPADLFALVVHVGLGVAVVAAHGVRLGG
jgi:4-hydroxybenzoate polyprenyltransferase